MPAEDDQLLDDVALERELRDAMKTEEEIDLFKIVSQRYSVKAELAENPVIKVILQGMWSNVADFFDAIVEAKTLIGLKADDPIIVKHFRMQADYAAVSAVNKALLEGKLAEMELVARDTMDQEQEGFEHE